jgi:predicted transcriptional regulator
MESNRNKLIVYMAAHPRVTRVELSKHLGMWPQRISEWLHPLMDLPADRFARLYRAVTEIREGKQT